MAEAGYAPGGVGDQLDRTARQVHNGDDVHTLEVAEYKPGVGRMYWTRCGDLLVAAHGAVLTTAPAGCDDCTAQGPTGVRRREMVEAILRRAPGGAR